jgi:serine phosphatase RsbU (regulator of sigma subunit)
VSSAKYDTDRDLVAQLRATVEQQQRELRMHQSELEQTNAGLLALHAEVERQRQRTAFLDEVSRTVSASLDGRAVIAALVGVLERGGTADSASVWTKGDDDQVLREPPGPAGEPDDAVTQVLTGHPAVVRPRRLVVPLAVGPNLVGVLDLRRTDADFTPDELSFVAEVAARAAVGLHNAGEYQRERELASRLQRAMLPTLSSPQGLELWPRYRPATRGYNVGGDWYDGFNRADGTMVLTVGDVTGHGMDAAVIMGRLQHVLRAYAMEGHGPAATLRLAHDLLRGWRSSLLASAVVVELDLATGRLRWASAGHLPVLVAAPAGGIRYLERPNAPLLGVPFGVDTAEYEVCIEPGSSLLLYTDGLVERRTEAIDTGLARLAEVFGSAVHLPTPQAGDHVLTEMLRATEQDDDVCLLLCRWNGPEATV